MKEKYDYLESIAPLLLSHGMVKKDNIISCELLDKEILLLLDFISEQNLSIRELRYKIKNKEYERLPLETKNKIVDKEETKITDFIKNPILIKNSYMEEKYIELLLKKCLDLKSSKILFINY